MTLSFEFDIGKYYDSGKIQKTDVEKVREFLKSNEMPHESDEMIGVFLMACGNDVEKAQMYSSAHYRGRKALPEIFKNRKLDNDKLKKQWNVM